MTDKERVLMTIIDRLYAQYALEHNRWGKDQEGVYFAPWKGGFCNENELKAGMLVLCMTSGIHDWKIGFLYKPTENDGRGWVIKEIGTNRLCNVTNESFCPIMGMSEISLLTEDNYLFYIKILKAFRRGGNDWYRFGGIEIIKPHKWKIFIREKWGGLNRPSIPFSFIIKWNKKTSIKYILEKMIESGYGTKEFEIKPREGTNI